jgi:hypothetical protein
MVSLNPTGSVFTLTIFILSALLILVGIGSLGGYTYSKSAVGTVVSATCRSAGSTLYNCHLTLSYPHNGTPIVTTTDILANRSYQANDTLIIYYNPKDPYTVSNIDTAPTMFLDWRVIIAGLVILVLPYLVINVNKKK